MKLILETTCATSLISRFLVKREFAQDEQSGSVFDIKPWSLCRRPPKTSAHSVSIHQPTDWPEGFNISASTNQ